MENLIKQRFVGKVLQEEGERMRKNQGVSIDKRLKFHSHNLVRKRDVKVSSEEGMDGVLTFSHVDYERFLDMKRKVKRKRSGGIRTRRGYRIHNRFMYGAYASIARRLMYDLTDELRESVKREIESGYGR